MKHRSTCLLAAGLLGLAPAARALAFSDGGDHFGRIPMPALLPTPSAGDAHYKTEAAYLPGFKSGSVTFWLKHELK